MEGEYRFTLRNHDKWLTLFILMTLIGINACVLKFNWLSIQEPSQAITDGTAQNVGDIICGPRCLKFLLEYYQKDKKVELIDLVKEVQWPAIESGASLKALKQSLESRGIYTRIVKASFDSEFQKNFPVIVHLSRQGELGHYIIQLPQSVEGRQVFWVGLDGFKLGHLRRITDWKVDYFIETSNVPIS